MRSKKIWMIAAIISVLLTVWGCTLAIPDASDAGEDILIGVFITEDYIDLFDLDGYLDDHAGQLKDGETLHIENDSQYEQKLYAVIDNHSSDDSSDWSVNFDDIQGINMFCPVWKDENGEKYRGTIFSEGICDTNSHINCTDDGDEYDIDGTIYILEGKADEDIAYHVNPVYQTADGRIYVKSGSGFSTSGESAEGECFSTTLSGECAFTENGETKTDKTSVTVHVSVIYKPIQITICQMNKDHEVMKKKIYNPGEIPDQLEINSEIAYILLETEKETLSREKRTAREIINYDPDGEMTLETWYLTDEEIVTKKCTELDWNR